MSLLSFLTVRLAKKFPANMNEQSEYGLRCPYCDESITVLIDGSVAEQDYVEDCEVCCRPIVLSVRIEADGSIAVLPGVENE